MTNICVAWSPFRGKFEAVVTHRGLSGKNSIARPMFFEEVEDGTRAEWPTFSLTPEEAQILSDQLWNAGVRPSGSKQSNGAFDAQGRHLEDMRRLVFKVGE